ncbi:hypothetical protein [Acidaminococcus timonensis]|jgi:hypothetical protein|uniref:hypothetical protein n=1 Tax=Acidaminococcus TaxID=904 RepID=UPI0025FABE77|nr:hypothetical protein [Acidaminococcus timonensis]
MKTWKKWLLLVCCLVASLCMTVPALAAEQTEPAAKTPGEVAMEADPLHRKQIAFVIYDRTGEATDSMKAVWKRQVRQAYPRAQYEFLPDPQAAEVANGVLGQSGAVDASVMDQIADKAGAAVVGILVVRNMEEYYVEPMFLAPWDDDGPDTYLRVITGADMYLYKKETGKFLQKKLRKIETKDVALSVHPQTEIQYALSNLAMKMEGKEQI